MIAYIVFIRPHKQLIMLILNALSEFLLLFLHLLSLVFLDDTMPESKANAIGWFINALVIVYILSNWVVVVILLVKDQKQKCIQRRQAKEEAKIKQEEERKERRRLRKEQKERQKKEEEERQGLLLKQKAEY